MDFIRLMAFDWTIKNQISLINPLYPTEKQRNENPVNNIVNFDLFQDNGIQKIILYIFFFFIALVFKLCQKTWYTS